MATSTIFMAGAKMASLLLGLHGPIKVNYINDIFDGTKAGELGRLYVGIKNKVIDYDDIEKFINYLDKKDYFRHYPLVDVEWDETNENIIRFRWTT